MQQTHALAPQLGASTCLGVKVILPLAAHQNLAGLRNLEALCVCFDRFHSSRQMYTNLRQIFTNHEFRFVIRVYSLEISC